MQTAATDGRDAVTKELEQVEVGQPLGLLAPPDFYGEAAKAYMIVQSGEPRFYGNLILRKGVLPPQ
jgi:L-fucose mutarotase/ribose pyranase (RbsD/FucU family)